MKTFSLAASILLLSSAAFATEQATTIEVRPPNGQPITVTVGPVNTETPNALTGNHAQPAPDTLNAYQNVGHN